MEDQRDKTVAIIGGGPAGFFAALACAEQCPSTAIHLFESAKEPLGKVRISGGGRCNVTNAVSDPRELVKHYPRGAKELLGPLHRFGTVQTQQWFTSRGVALKTEDDGRVFPASDDSASVVNLLLAEAERLGVNLHCSEKVRSLSQDGGRFSLQTAKQELQASAVLLATGSSRAGHEIAASFGHTIVPPVPSLFTFEIEDALLAGLAGITVTRAAITLLEGDKPILSQQGPILITHWGLSGPAILRLSAWGARKLHDLSYRTVISVNWCGLARAQAEQSLREYGANHGGQRPHAHALYGIPQRLWERLSEAAVGREKNWARLSAQDYAALTDLLVECRLTVTGKGEFKEEFVTCGGIRLEEVDFRTMQSRIIPRLYFAGEILDLDGLTGGFNFQIAWTTGWIAARQLGQ